MHNLEKLTSINDICLYVRDFNQSLKFYTEKFGFKVKRLQPNAENPNYAEFDFHGTGVTIWDRAGVCTVLNEKYLRNNGHAFMIAVKVPAFEDVDNIYQELTSRGVKCICEPTTYEFGARASYYTDYEDNIWEVFAWEEGNGPGLL